MPGFLLLAVIVAAAEPEVARPAGAVGGPSVARVLRGKGDVTINDGKAKVFKAEPGLPLVKTDVVKVPMGGFAALELKNGYVVRIDEDIELAVADIALLDAPKAKQTAADQLEALLLPEEKGGFAPERLIGWYATPTAAVVPSIQQANETGVLKKAPGGKSDSAKPVETSRSNGPRKEPSQEAEMKASPAEMKPSPAAQPARQLPPPPPPLDVAKDAQLIACFTSLKAELNALKGMKKLGATMKLRYKLENGVVSLTLPGAIPPPACARDWFAANAASLRPGTFNVELPLK